MKSLVIYVWHAAHVELAPPAAAWPIAVIQWWGEWWKGVHQVALYRRSQFINQHPRPVRPSAEPSARVPSVGKSRLYVVGTVITSGLASSSRVCHGDWWVHNECRDAWPPDWPARRGGSEATSRGGGHFAPEASNGRHTVGKVVSDND